MIVVCWIHDDMITLLMYDPDSAFCRVGCLYRKSRGWLAAQSYELA